MRLQIAMSLTTNRTTIRSMVHGTSKRSIGQFVREHVVVFSHHNNHPRYIDSKRVAEFSWFTMVCYLICGRLKDGFIFL